MHAVSIQADSATHSQVAVLVILQHGSHGHAADFDNVRAHLESAWHVGSLAKVPLEVWTTPVNEGLATDDGLVVCGDRLAIELSTVVRQMKARHVSKQIHIACVGHSFGGPILRFALGKLESSGSFADVALAMFVTLASPHLGARQLSPVLRLGARTLGAVFSTAYKDLLLDSDAFDQLCTEQVVAPLSRFRHRLLYACARGDHLIAFETGSLTVPFGGIEMKNLPPPVEDGSNVRCALLLDPFDPCLSDDASETTRVLQIAKPDGSHVASAMREAVQLQLCVEAFGGFDDRQGRAHRAAQMLQALRSVGRWVLYIVDFPEKFVLRHGAIIQHPSRVGNPTGAGADVAMHLANTLCSSMREVVCPEDVLPSLP